MSHIKTAISLEKFLFQQVEETAADLHISRSRLFAMAVEEFIQRRRTRQLLDAINTAYADSPDEEEQQTVTAIKEYLPKVLDPW